MGLCIALTLAGCESNHVVERKAVEESAGHPYGAMTGRSAPRKQEKQTEERGKH